LAETRREKFEKQLRGIIVLLFVLAFLNIYTSKRFTMTEISVFISIFMLWGVFEWIIKVNRVLHRIENAKTFEEFLIAFFSLLALLIKQEIANRIENVISRIWKRINNHY